MYFLYAFTLQFLYNSTCFERPFRSSSGVHKFTVFCSSVQTMLTCLTVRSYGWNNHKTERNGLSKHVELYKNCRVNTYRKCILLVCLYNWLRCTVHKMSKFIPWLHQPGAKMKNCQCVLVYRQFKILNTVQRLSYIISFDKDFQHILYQPPRAFVCVCVCEHSVVTKLLFVSPLQTVTH